MKYLVTSALPYANGPLHFGHMSGAYIPADVFVRHKKLLGDTVKYICGSDEHGVAIMLNAQKEGRSYQEYVDSWNQNHQELFKKYDLEFDFYGQTSADYHEEEVIKWFNSLNEKGFIEPREAQQLKCSDCNNHLPDRFVEGECYSCGFQSARGDECPQCGIWIESTKLKNPVCKICNSKNISEVSVTQYYLLMSKFHKKYRSWLESKNGSWKKSVYPFVDSLTREKMHDRAISRDLDWGIDVPIAEAVGKKLYVWFDAPIGYVSNTKQHLLEIGSSEDYIKDWWGNKETKIVNFIGKDNIIFHGVIFPFMSMASEIVRPVDDLPANQYVNLAGKPFSKSTGWYIDSTDALEKLGVDKLRYYLISIIPENSDSTFTWDHFAEKVNNELANNLGNLANRCLKFFHKNWKDGINKEMFLSFSETKECQTICDIINKQNELLDKYQFRKALDDCMSIGHLANTYFSDREPWAQIKEDELHAKETIAHTSIMILILGTNLSPFLPNLSKEVLSLFKEDNWEALYKKGYNGDISGLIKELVGDDTLYKIVKAPKVLVPKIDEDQLSSLNELLNSKQD